MEIKQIFLAQVAFAIVLFGVVSAEPGYGYGGYGGYRGYGGYGYGGYRGGYGHYGKRDAEAKADPYLYGGYYGHGLGHGYGYGLGYRGYYWG